MLMCKILSNNLLSMFSNVLKFFLLILEPFQPLILTVYLRLRSWSRYRWEEDKWIRECCEVKHVFSLSTCYLSLPSSLRHSFFPFTHILIPFASEDVSQQHTWPRFSRCFLLDVSLFTVYLCTYMPSVNTARLETIQWNNTCTFL